MVADLKPMSAIGNAPKRLAEFLLVVAILCHYGLVNKLGNSK